MRYDSLFSVVIVTKDRAELLFRAIKSVLNSKLKPLDIVVVNDGGTPPDLTSIDFYGVRIKLINNPESKGANFSRNLAIEESCCDIVFLLDDDDAFSENPFEKRLTMMTSDENIGLSYTGARVVKSNSLENISRTIRPKKFKDVFYELLSQGNVIGSTSRVAIRKEHFFKAGKFNEDLACLQDYDLWIRLAKISSVYSDEQVNTIYTIHDNKNQISSNYKKYLSTGIVIRDSLAQELISLNLFNKFTSSIYLRASISASSSSYRYQVYYALLSFIKHPTIKSLIFLGIPGKILKKVINYV